MQEEVDILVNGRPVKQIAHEGKIFIVAKAGQPYEIRLKNNSTSRVLGVCSVDGRNVVDGEPATPNGAGYVVNGFGSYTIKGFRTSNNEVHPFIFDAKEESYANKVEEGSTQDCGVIGVVFHYEKPWEYKITRNSGYYSPFPPYQPYVTTTPYNPIPMWGTYTCNNASTYGMSASFTCDSSQGSPLPKSAQSMNFTRSAAQSSGEFDLGTKFSDSSVEDRVTDTEFKIGGELGRIEIYYASRGQLESMGVPVEQAKSVAFPRAFGGFCKPPRKK